MVNMPPHRKAVEKYDHPVRTIFIETVMNRFNIEESVAAEIVSHFTTEEIDDTWPISEVAALFGQ